MIYICILYNFVFIYDGLSLTSSIHSITFLWDRTSDARYQGFCTSMEWGSIVPMPRAGRLQKVFMFGESTLCRSWSQADSWRLFFEDDGKSPGMNSSGQPFTWQRRTMMSMAFAAYWSGVLMSTFATTRSARPSTWLLWVDIRRWIYGENGWYRIPGDLVLVEVPK